MASYVIKIYDLLLKNGKIISIQIMHTPWTPDVQIVNFVIEKFKTYISKELR